MSTLIQSYKRTHLKNLVFNLKLSGHPQCLCVVSKVRLITPRKPNSARRQCTKMYRFATLYFMKLFLLGYIPGSGHNLRKFSNVLVRGGGARDLPNVHYSCIRGVRDFSGSKHKTKRRSIYGTKNTKKKKFRRIFRFF